MSDKPFERQALALAREIHDYYCTKECSEYGDRHGEKMPFVVEIRQALVAAKADGLDEVLVEMGRMNARALDGDVDDNEDEWWTLHRWIEKRLREVETWTSRS